MDPILKEDIRVRLPAVSNDSGVKSDLKPLRPEHGPGQASAVHSLSVVTTSLSPFPPLPAAPSAPTKFLPSLPTPEQRKRLLTRNIRAIPPQLQNHHKTGCIKDFRPEKGSKGQLHTPPPHLNSGPGNHFHHHHRHHANMSTAATLPNPPRPPGYFHRRGPSQHHPHLKKHMGQHRFTPSTHTGVPLYNPHQGWGPQQNQAVARLKDDWTTWNELAIRLIDLPACTRTRDVLMAFSNQGSIDYIELYEDDSGKRSERGIIKFKPPPIQPFWLSSNRYPISVTGLGVVDIQISLLPQARRVNMIPSPVDSKIEYPESIMVKARSLDFGFMRDSETMESMFKTVSAPQKEIVFRQQMRRAELVIEFYIEILDARPSTDDPKFGELNRSGLFRFYIPFSQMHVIHRVSKDPEKTTLVISMETPPRFYRERHDTIPQNEMGKRWTQNDAWFRQTDIVYDRNKLQVLPLTLKKEQPIIDIGRWTTYCLDFDLAKNSDKKRFDLMADAFRDHNVDIKDFSGFKLVAGKDPAVWEYLNEPLLKMSTPRTILEDLMMEDTMQPLAFPVRYQLEVCISQGCLRENTMTKNFVSQLTRMDPIKAQDLLEFVAKQKKRIYDPMEIFQMHVLDSLSSRPKIPHYCVYIRSATITPSTLYFNTPTVETSNRVVRQYSHCADRFLRVRFTDEKFEVGTSCFFLFILSNDSIEMDADHFKGRINSTGKDNENEVFTRIYRTMKNGIIIGDRHYEFLAFGNSQFREHGAYFFAPLPDISARDIRKWMGDFEKIKVVAKYAARIGQCFSTTRAVKGMKASVIEIKDIERNGFCFTDGVGKISAFLAQLVAFELGIINSGPGPPSAFQFRLGGCKGVLALCPEAQPRDIHIRPSQYKFPAEYQGLEIIRWSQFAVASLNRQLILVLSALGVADDVFIRKLQMQLSNLEQAMTDPRMALGLLQKDVDANQMTLQVAGMINDGFHAANEPFVTSLLLLWRAWSIKYLKEKAKITVTDGALLLGCIDETGILQGHFEEARKTPPNHITGEGLPEVFVQVSRGPENKPFIVEGPMLLGRNPSLHPGDFRVVRGVDIPKLHHMTDVVVFPQTGDRDIPSMCSGGDLDGDDFLVMWDKELLPRDWNEDPMDYKAPEPMQVEGEITTDDITRFFVNYMRNDTLPQIALAHLALGDFSENGIRDEKCLRLATLHSMAVDYVKTGEPAEMPQDLRPRKWPHFMEKRHKPKEQTYTSQKILGQLYDQVERVDFVPAYSSPFDKRILDAYNLSEQVLYEAGELKVQYDAAVLRIMAQHEIQTEFEVWSTFVLHHVGDTKDFKFHEVIGELSSALKYQFREVCYKKAGGKEYEHIAPFVAAMYKVTADQVASAIKECQQIIIVGGQETQARKMTPANMPLMSFPWLFQGILGKIAQAIEIVPGQWDDTNLPLHRRPKHKKGLMESLSFEDDNLETHEGVTHRGEVLELFENPGVQSDPYAGLEFLGGSNEPGAASETKLTSKSTDSVNFSNPVAPLVESRDTADLLGLFDLLGLDEGSDAKCGVPGNKLDPDSSHSAFNSAKGSPIKPNRSEALITSSEGKASQSEDLFSMFEKPSELSLVRKVEPHSIEADPGSSHKPEVLQSEEKANEQSGSVEVNKHSSRDLIDLFGFLDEPGAPPGVLENSPSQLNGSFSPYTNSEKEDTFDFGTSPEFVNPTSHHDDMIRLFDVLDEPIIEPIIATETSHEPDKEDGQMIDFDPTIDAPSTKTLKNIDLHELFKAEKTDVPISARVNGLNVQGASPPSKNEQIKKAERVLASTVGLLNDDAKGADYQDGNEGSTEDDAEEVHLVVDTSTKDAYSRLESLLNGSYTLS